MSIPWDELPALLDRPAMRDRLGLKRRDIDRIFARCTEHRIEGSSKPYVSRDEVREAIDTREPVPYGGPV